MQNFMLKIDLKFLIIVYFDRMRTRCRPAKQVVRWHGEIAQRTDAYVRRAIKICNFKSL